MLYAADVDEREAQNAHDFLASQASAACQEIFHHNRSNYYRRCWYFTQYEYYFIEAAHVNDIYRNYFKQATDIVTWIIFSSHTASGLSILTQYHAFRRTLMSRGHSNWFNGAKNGGRQRHARHSHLAHKDKANWMAKALTSTKEFWIFTHDTASEPDNTTTIFHTAWLPSYHRPISLLAIRPARMASRFAHQRPAITMIALAVPMHFTYSSEYYFTATPAANTLKVPRYRTRSRWLL